MADNIIFNSKVGAEGFTVNRQAKDYKIGESVYLNVNNTPTEFLVVHQGKPSSMYDDSCNGTWLLMKDCYTQMKWNENSVNAYADSDVHLYLNDIFLGLLDVDVQSAIKQIKLPYCVGNGDWTIKSGANGLLTKVFLLSGYEIGWTQGNTDGYLPIDGAKLDYFTEGSDSSVWEEKIANYDGSADGWWLRSPYTYKTVQAWCVDYDGDYFNNGLLSICGIRPALILPSEYSIISDEVIHAGNISEQSVAKATTADKAGMLMQICTFKVSEVSGTKSHCVAKVDNITKDLSATVYIKQVHYDESSDFSEAMVKDKYGIFELLVVSDASGNPYASIRQITGDSTLSWVFSAHHDQNSGNGPALFVLECSEADEIAIAVLRSDEGIDFYTEYTDANELDYDTLGYVLGGDMGDSTYLYLGDPSITEAQAKNLKTLAAKTGNRVVIDIDATETTYNGYINQNRNIEFGLYHVRLVRESPDETSFNGVLSINDEFYGENQFNFGKDKVYENDVIFSIGYYGDYHTFHISGLVVGGTYNIILTRIL